MLDFIKDWFWLLLILSMFLAFGIAGFYVDKNTNILEIEKKKRELREKSMSVDALKSQIKNKNLSLGGTMGVKSGNDLEAPMPASLDNNTPPASLQNQPADLQAGEDLNAPLNLNGH